MPRASGGLLRRLAAIRTPKKRSTLPFHAVLVTSGMTFMSNDGAFFNSSLVLFKASQDFHILVLPDLERVPRNGNVLPKQSGIQDPIHHLARMGIDN